MELSRVGRCIVAFCLSACFSSICFSAGVEATGSVGVNYGRIANDLPSAVKVVELLKSQGVNKVKLYDTDATVLQALSGTGIKVIVALPNEQLSEVSASSLAAYSWVQKNVAAYLPGTRISAVAVGNEVFVDSHNTTDYLVPAMINVHTALTKLGLDRDIKISSPIALSALQTSYPSSAGAFRSDLVERSVKPMLDFLRQTGSFLMVNAYPFFAYKDNADVISLDYALFRPNPGVVDSGSGLRYTNLFDAQIDAVFAAMSALKYSDLNIMVSETGWPSEGDSDETGASKENAAAYNGNLVLRVLTGAGTPLRPQASLDVYLFALFNENKKNGPTSERNYGLFYPNEQKVYDIPLTPEGLKQHSAEEPPVSSAGGGMTVPVEAPGVVVRSSSPSESLHGQTWCVANERAEKERVQAALDYACGEGGADCTQIQPGSTCFQPDTLLAHASYAFNSYYQRHSRSFGTCDFKGAAYVVTQPPRFGNCVFPTGY
ncbi:unnamed protein product [Victoria cruziana]